MALTVTGMAQMSSLMNSVFGNTGTTTSSLLANTLLKSGSTNALSKLAGSAASSAQNATANQQAFNRTELALRNAAKKLNSANAESVFNTGGAVSSNANAVGATLASNAQAGTYSVSVTQLAQAQKTTGANLASAATAGISTGAGGYAQIQINSGGKQNTVSFQLTGSETNQQAIQKMADAINSRNTGVNAKVTTDNAGNSRLDLTGQSGAANSFTVQDVVGNAAAATGVTGAASQSAQDAKATINGTNYTSATNSVAVGTTGVTIDLKQTTTKTETVTVSAGNPEDVEKAVREYVSQYNDTMKSLKGNTAYYAQGSATTLQALTAVGSRALRDIGVNSSTTGEMTIDETKFKQALSSNPGAVRSAFSGGGYARGVQAEAERAINQSLATPITGGFTGLTGTSSNYGISLNNYIASNVGFFLNSYM